MIFSLLREEQQIKFLAVVLLIQAIFLFLKYKALNRKAFLSYPNVNKLFILTCQIKNTVKLIENYAKRDILLVPSFFQTQQSMVISKRPRLTLEKTTTKWSLPLGKLRAK